MTAFPQFDYQGTLVQFFIRTRLELIKKSVYPFLRVRFCPAVEQKIHLPEYPRYPRKPRFLGFKKTFKKAKKKLARPRRVPLNGDLTRQIGREDRSKKL